MKGRSLVVVGSGAVAACVVWLVGGVAAASGPSQGSAASEAAAPSTPVFSRGIGAVLPTNGQLAEVSVSCPESSGGACRGSVALVPRGDTARALGSGALASDSFTLARGADADLKLRLSGSARDKLSHGPLFVTARLRAEGSGSPISIRLTAIYRERPYSPPSRLAADAANSEHSWSWTIPKAHYLVLNKFLCPSGEPVLARGRNASRSGYQYDAKMDGSASDGTGVSGFDLPTLGPKVTGAPRATYYYTMAGWPKGDVFSNSIWAPIRKDGHFKLTVQCTDINGSKARLVDTEQLGAFASRRAYYRNFFPWRWSLG